MDKLIYGSIRANGIKIQYYRSGEDKQPVIMLHGLTDSGLCWNFFAMALQPAYDVILLRRTRPRTCQTNLKQGTVQTIMRPMWPGLFKKCSWKTRS